MADILWCFVFLTVNFNVIHKIFRNSQFQDVYTLEQILKSPKIFDPLTKLQCCPTSDGAAAAIVCSEDFVARHGLYDQAIEILGMEMVTDTPSTFKGNAMTLVS